MSVYASEPAQRLVDLAFPRQARVSSISKALHEVDRAAPTDLDGVLQWQLDAGFPHETNDAVVDLDSPETTESEWLWMAVRPTERDALTNPERVAEIVALCARVSEGWVRGADVVQRALLQRDLSQMVSAYLRASREEVDPEKLARAAAALSSLTRVWRLAFLAEADLARLRKLSPSSIRAPFVREHAFDPARDYIPSPVVRDLADWHVVTAKESGTLHFQTYEGRSFVSIYMKVPGWNDDAVRGYRARVAREFGADVTVRGDVPPLPAGTETVLVRTIGVFMADGTLADSYWPEEVLVRIFKYEVQKIDASTTDQRGILQYRYKLSRIAARDGAGGLALCRVRDDQMSFYGFLGDAPDPHRSTSRGLTTMKFSCIGCHSELLYGASTVFSLGVGPARAATPAHEGVTLEPAPAGEGRYRLLGPLGAAAEQAVRGGMSGSVEVIGSK